MAKGYWVVCYRNAPDRAVLAAYAKLAGPVIEAAGRCYLARGGPAAVFEAGLAQRLLS
jgi:uncharacterized protein (DUF1330 family)